MLKHNCGFGSCACQSEHQFGPVEQQTRFCYRHPFPSPRDFCETRSHIEFVVLMEPTAGFKENHHTFVSSPHHVFYYHHLSSQIIVKEKTWPDTRKSFVEPCDFRASRQGNGLATWFNSLQGNALPEQTRFNISSDACRNGQPCLTAVGASAAFSDIFYRLLICLSLLYSLYSDNESKSMSFSRPPLRLQRLCITPLIERHFVISMITCIWHFMVQL